MVTPELRVILVFLTSLISTLFLIPKLSRIATRIGLVDQPGLRKIHDRPLPLVGGLAMVISATFSFLLFIPLDHGFEFLEFDADQDQVIFRLLVKQKIN